LILPRGVGEKSKAETLKAESGAGLIPKPGGKNEPRIARIARIMGFALITKPGRAKTKAEKLKTERLKTESPEFDLENAHYISLSTAKGVGRWP